MKKFLFIAVYIVSLSLFAQSPERFNFQAAARDLSGAVYSNSNIGLRISILHNGASGTPVFVETHTATTNNVGVFNVQIGNGALQSGNFSSINWGNGMYFVKIEMDATGGTNYGLLSNTQLLSVPYALHAESVGSIDWTNITNVPASLLDGDGDVLAGLSCGTNQIAIYNGTAWVCGNLTAGSVNWSSLTNIPANISSLASLNCSNGQVPVFNGTSWTCGSLPKTQIFQVVSSTQTTVLATTTSYTSAPGLSYNINLSVPSTVNISALGGFQCADVGTAYAVVDLAIYVDGVVVPTGGQGRFVAANTQGLGQIISRWNLNNTVSLSAGAHTVEIRYKDGVGTADALLGGSNALIQNSMNLIVTPQ